jgi:arsenate reductase
MKIYHNPRCSKSRQTLSIIKEHGIEPEIIKYLNDTPTKEELTTLIEQLGIAPHDLIRTNEKIYKEKFKGKSLSDEEWVEAMVEYPKLIQRPIVVSEGKAVLGRPPEKVLTLIED